MRIGLGLVVSVLLLSLLANLYLGSFFVSSMSLGASEQVYQEGDAAHRIVILPLRGTVDDSMARYVHQALDALRKDPPAAIVLRVDSPGGGVEAADHIWHELDQFRRATKVKIVSSYGAIAASGGYYISCLSDYIYCEPTTITGSVGVIMTTFTVGDLLKKIGVDPVVLTARTSPDKDVANNPFRPWEPKDTAEVQPFLDDIHKVFMERVFAGRSRVVPGLTMADVEKASTGQAMMEAQAQSLKLVDAQGYLDDALAKARELAGLANAPKPEVTVLTIRKGLLADLGLRTEASNPLAHMTGEEARDWLLDLSTPRMEYRYMPGVAANR